MSDLPSFPSLRPKLPDHQTLDKCPSPHDNTGYDGACYASLKATKTWADAECSLYLGGRAPGLRHDDREDSFVSGGEAEQSLRPALWMGLDNQSKWRTFTWSVRGGLTIYTLGGERSMVTPVRPPVRRLNVTDGSWLHQALQPNLRLPSAKYTNGGDGPHALTPVDRLTAP
ncbi:Snaclec 6 [Chionoecetes opilio]|uniref:Snaclec 6 n=1 Tax=Chionoecetes opilio TaxID=41210 RepID=A0A8J4YNQ4_CHIOP|nr:Snaclec 6 [Chionoecetes opilio]